MHKLILIMLLACFSGGCWDRVEVDQMTFPVALGIDKVSEGQYQVFAQIAIVEGGGTSGVVKKQFKVLDGKGETISKALINLASKVAQRVSFSHVKSCVVTEKVAKEGLSKVFDLLERSMEFRPNIFILVTTGDLKEMFDLEPTAETAFASPLQAVQLVKEQTNEVVNTNLREYSSKMFAMGDNVVVGRAEVEKSKSEPDLRFAGGAAFKRDKLVGWLDTTEVTAWILVTSHTGN